MYDHSRVNKVSVIVPVYNGEKYIGRCIRSLLDQNLEQSDYEIVVIDDGSVDRSGFVIQQLKSPFESRLKFISHDENLGLPAALNTGIRACSGSHIVRVDADDFVNKNFLLMLRVWLELNEEYDAVACDYFLVDDSERFLERCSGVTSPIGCGVLFSKDHVEDIGSYDEEMLWHEDIDFRVRFENKYRIGNLDVPLYRYRRHQDNMTLDVENMNKFKSKLRAKHD